jgi:hypothetical protein
MPEITMEIDETQLNNGIGARLAQFRNDPLGFVLWAFPWGKAGTELEKEYPDRWQIEAMEDIRLALEVNEGLPEDQRVPIQMAIASGHGIGKTAFMAWINLWFISTNINPQIVVTANTEKQLTTKTWRELSKWHKLMVHSHLFEWTATKFFLKESPETWAANAIPWSKNTTESFAGTHAESVLYEFDEGSGIVDGIYDVSEGAMTSGRCLWLVFGNPTRSTGRFRAIFGKFRHRWITRAIDSRTARKTNKAKIQQWVDDYGEDSDFVRVRVRGIFPQNATGQLISEEAVDYCMREYKAIGYEMYPVSICVDVAREGDDLVTVGVWQGKKCHELRGYARFGDTKTTTIRTATLAADAYRAFRDKYPNNKIHIFVDDNGVGGGVTDILESWKLPVTGVNSGRSADEPEKFLNKRAEMWWRGALAVQDGYELPNIERLRDDLVNMTYTQTVPAMKIQMTAVKDLKTMDLPSPDYGTNFVLQFAYPQLLSIIDPTRAASKRSGGSTTMARRRDLGYGVRK